jgi:hypothetical protein
VINCVPGQSKTFSEAVHIPGTGAATSAVTATFALYDEDETAIVTSESGSHAGSGVWSATLTIPSTNGSYTLLTTIAHASIETYYTRQQVLVGPALNRGGVTRAQLRYDVARKLGDVLRTKCTTGASTTIFTDTENLYEPDDYFIGREFVLVVGHASNVGLRRRVTDSDESSSNVTVHLALPQNFAAGDVADLYDTNEIGVRLDDLNGAINDAIQEAAKLGGQRLSATLTATFDRDDPLLDIPSQFLWLTGVEYQDEVDVWRRIDRAPGFRGGGWTVRQDGRTVEIGGADRDRADARPVRIFGLGRHDPLGSDEDATLVDHAWLTANCLWHLYHLKATRDHSDASERQMGYWGGVAKEYAPRAVVHKPPHAVRTGHHQ